MFRKNYFNLTKNLTFGAIVSHSATSGKPGCYYLYQSNYLSVLRYTSPLRRSRQTEVSSSLRLGTNYPL